MSGKDVVIIGGGPAGLAAALRLHELGLRDIVILERERRLGGILRQCIHDGFGLTRFGTSLSGPEYAQRFIDEIDARGIERITDASVVSLDKDRRVRAASRQGLIEYDAAAVILAMGCRERTRGSIGVPGHRPAGVLTAGVAQAYINLNNLMPGKEVVILGSGDVGLIMARRFSLEGAQVLGVFEIQPYPSGLARNLRQCLEDFDIPLHLSHTVVGVKGEARVEAVTIAKVDASLRTIPGTEYDIACDTLILSVGLIPENELSLMAGVELDPRTNGPKIDQGYQTSVPGIFAAGNVLKVHDLVDFVSLEAERVAESVADFVTRKELTRAAVHVVHISNPSIAAPQSAAEVSVHEISLLGTSDNALDANGELLCIRCPRGCRLALEFNNGEIAFVRNAACPKGKEYAIEEFANPQRNIATSILVKEGEEALASVRLNGTIPRDSIRHVCAELSHLEMNAPVNEGQVVARNILGFGVDVIATKGVARRWSNGTSKYTLDTEMRR